MQTKHIALTLFLITGLFAIPAQADVIAQYNFGADISETTGYEDWVHADQTYNSTDGFGFTFSTGLLYRDYSAAGVDPDVETTCVLDVRNANDENKLRPLYTFRMDIPNGTYNVSLT